MKNRREFLRTSTAASLSLLVGCRNGAVDDLAAPLAAQHHHDYFREATFGLEQAEEWVAFLEAG